LARVPGALDVRERKGVAMGPANQNGQIQTPVLLERVVSLAKGASGHDSWERSPALLGVWDHWGYLQAANPAYQDAFGWSVDELRSVPFWEFIHPDDRHPVVESRQRLMTDPGADFDTDVRMLYRDGTYRLTRWKTHAVPDEPLLCAVGAPLTAPRHQPYQTVRAGVWDWHIPADTITTSAELVDFIGRLDARTVSSLAFLKHVHLADRHRVQREIRATLTSGEPLTTEFRIMRTDGVVQWLYVAGSLDSDSNPEHLRGIAHDVTEHRGPQTRSDLRRPVAFA
jgi:rsbT co-antagonist protein RsbR